MPHASLRTLRISLTFRSAATSKPSARSTTFYITLTLLSTALCTIPLVKVSILLSTLHFILCNLLSLVVRLCLAESTVALWLLARVKLWAA